MGSNIDNLFGDTDEQEDEITINKQQKRESNIDRLFSGEDIDKPIIDEKKSQLTIFEEPPQEEKTTLRKAHPEKEKKDTVLKKMARFVLPKELEYRWGLTTRTIQSQMQELESARLSYLRSKRQEKHIKKEGVTEEMKTDPEKFIQEDYKEPTGFLDTMKESLVLNMPATIYNTVGGFTEMAGQKIGSPEMIQWGEQFGDKATAYILKNPKLLPDKNIKGVFSGGIKDPRAWGKSLGELIPSITTMIGSTMVGGLVGGPAGATMSAYSSSFVLESGNAYRGYIDEGMPADKASTIAGVYGVIASKLENALGVMPSKIGSKFFGKQSKQLLYKGFTGFLKKELPKIPIKILKTVLGEMGEETAQQFAENLGLKFFDKHADIFNGLVESAEGGFVGGLAFGGANALPSLRNIKFDKKNKVFEPEIKEEKPKPEIDNETVIKDIPKLKGKNVSEIRDELISLNKKIDQAKGDERNTLIKKENLLRDQLNVYNGNNQEIILEIPQKNKATSLAEISVVQYDDNKWAVHTQVNANTTGLTLPFDGKFDTKKIAVDSAVNYLQEWIEKQTPIDNKIEETQLKQIKNELLKLQKIDFKKPAIELQKKFEEKEEEKKEDKYVYHGTPVDTKKILKEGFVFGTKDIFGAAAYFTDSKELRENFGENYLKLKIKDFKLKTFDKIQERFDFIEKMKTKNLADAIRKQGKYDGFIILNPNKEVGNTHAITNNELLNKMLGVKTEKPIIKKQIKLTEEKKKPIIKEYDKHKPTISSPKREVPKERISETLPVAQEKPERIRKPVEERGKDMARERDIASRPGVGVRPQITNEEIKNLVDKATNIVDGEVFLSEKKLTEEEIESLLYYQPAGGRAKEGATGKGLLDEYYTDDRIVDIMGELTGEFLEKKDIQVLEPSIGIGNFISGTPDNSKIFGYETNPTTAKITKLLHQDTNIYNLPIESLFMDERGGKRKFEPKYDLVIGNPPYGKHRGKYKGLGEEIKIEKYEEYFIKRGLDLLNENGILAMIVPSGFIRSKNNYAKQEIFKIGELLNAFRLPNGVFETTDIGTDILIFKKTKKEDRKSNILSDDIYFKTNPDNILGEEKERKGKYGMEKYVDGTIDEAMIKFIKIKNSDIAKEVVDNNDPDEPQIEKDDTETRVSEELDKVDNLFTYKKLREKPINEITKKEKEPQRPKTKTGKKQVNEKVIKFSPKKTNKLLRLKQYSTADKKDKELWENITATGELKEGIKIDANYYKARYYNDFNYYQGDIYNKLDRLEIDKNAISEKQYNIQKEGLKKVLPPIHTVEKMILSPNTSFVHDVKIKDYTSKGKEWTGSGYRQTTETGDKELSKAFINWVQDLPAKALGGSSNWEIRGYVNGEVVRGGDKIHNQKERVRRREVGDRLFKLFLKDGLTDKQKKFVEDQYNRKFNSYHRPNYRNVPLVGNLHFDFKKKPLDIKEVQLQGVGFLVNKGLGILAHDVGVGKTMQAIISINEVIARGWAKKPLVVVPSVNVYNQWVEEIHDLLPDIKINLLENLGARFKGDLASLEIGDGSISIISYEGFKRLGFETETYNDLTKDLNDVMKKPKDMGATFTLREEEKEYTKTEERIGKGIKGTTAKRSFESLGFDHLTFDEVHNANHIIAGAKVKDNSKGTEFRGLRINPSELGIKTWLASQYIQKKNNGRNVFLLSATPFTNNPMEYYSILSLVGRERLKSMRISNVNDFMNMFMDISFDWEFKANGKYEEKNDIKNFKNYQQFQKLLTEFIDFRDGDEAGVLRPERQNKNFIVNPSNEQSDYMDKAQELFDDKENKNAGVLRGITEMRKIAFSQYASMYNTGIPNYKKFIENTPKLNLLAKLIKQNKKDKKEAGQLIYSTIGIEFFPLIKEYLIKEVGYKPNEVAIISGGVSMDKRIPIQEKFNKGEIKIVIGSDAIKEGVNLQRNTTDLYILSLTWNFTQLKQVIGRAWRQGNQWGKVRINNIFTENSIDIFQSQKLSNKEKRYENALKFKGDLLDVGDVNFEELKFDLITDPELRLKLEHTLAEKDIKKLIAEQKSDVGYFGRKVKKLIEIDDKITQYEEYIKDDPRYWKKEVEEVKAKKSKLLKEYQDKGINISELQKGLEEKKAKLKIKEKELEDLSVEFEKKEKEIKAKSKKEIIKTKETDYQSILNKRQQENKTFYDVEAKGSEGASVGIFKEEKEITLGDIDKIRPIEFPELVDMARELMDDVPTLKKLPRSLGKFYGRGKGEIKLKPELFKKGQEKQLSAVLAHEIGHLIDYLPQKTLKRGNLLGRLMSLRKFLKNTYGHLSVSNKELREELKTASLYWRPTNNWNAYRNSAKELYADAISMLFVNPGKLQKLAPNFYNNFFKSLDNKEEVKKAYFELQEILRGDKKSITERRREGVRQMFNEADYKAKDLQRINEEDKKKRKLNFWTAFKFNIKSVNQEVYDKVNKVEKQGGYINPDYNPKYLLEERNYLGSLIKAQFEKFVQPIHKDLEKNNIDWDDLGEILMYERITSGDRSEMANPRGISPVEAQEMLDSLKQELGEEKTKILETNLDMFRNFNQSIIDEAYNEGLIKDDMYKKIQDNPKYATYRVIEYMDKNVDWKMKRQIGTLKDIDNPANAMLLKTMSSIRAIHNQKTRVSTIELLEKNYENDIKDAKMVWTGKTHAPIKSKDRNEKLITYYDKGKLKGKYVDPYIASSIENNTIGRNQMVIKLLSPITFLNRKYFRPIFVIYNPGWMPFNFVRDFVRVWKNTPNMSLFKTAKRYYQAGKIARARVTKKDGEGKDLLIEMEQNMIINTLTWNDLLAGETTEDKQIVDILKRTGVIETENKKYNLLLRPIIALGRAIRTAGDYVETLPKAAAFIEVKENLTPEKASDIRKKAGSPDFFEKGYLTPATNEIFLFSNPFIQAWFADVEVATDPKTRSGFWFKTAMKEFVPKLLMYGALAGLFTVGDDDKIKKIMDGVSEYDMTNYTIIPIGIDKINGKSIYLRIPTDETGRVLGGIFWKLLKTAKGDKTAMSEISQVLNYAGGQVPGLTPSIGSPIKMAEFLQGENPYDDFHGRNVISETEFEAGGWHKTKPFLGWIFQQSGGNIFMRFNVSTYAPREKIKGEKILSLPVVSNIIGRWLKISDYGKREKLREEIIDPAKKERAIEKLEERKIINKYIEEYKITNKSISVKTKLERKLIKEIIGHVPQTKTEKTKAGSLKRQFRISLAYGQNDPKISSLMEAGTNDIKIKLLKEFDKELSKEKFNELKKILLQYKVVSSAVLREYKRQ